MISPLAICAEDLVENVSGEYFKIKFVHEQFIEVQE
jgi:hypothetical protein